MLGRRRSHRHVLRRLIAGIVDGTLLALLARVVESGLRDASPAEADDRTGWTSPYRIARTFPVIAGLSAAILAATNGRSLGRWLSGVRVVPMRGDRLTLLSALARDLGSPAAATGVLASAARAESPLPARLVVLGALVADVFFILIRRDGRALHDLIAGTRVVRE